MSRALVILALAVSLSSCATRADLEAGLHKGLFIYCYGVTEAGKQAIRDALTGGQQVISCPFGTAATTVGP